MIFGIAQNFVFKLCYADVEKFVLKLTNKPSGTSYRAVRWYYVLIRGLAHYFTISLLSGRNLM